MAVLMTSTFENIFFVMLSVYMWTWRVLCASNIIIRDRCLSACILFQIDLCGVHSHLRSNVRCCFCRCASLCVMLETLIRSHFNSRAETALESNCAPISTLILVRITIYTVMALALSTTDFVEWLWDFSTRHLMLCDQINSRGVKPYVHTQ
jgi:hypothetical protein